MKFRTRLLLTTIVIVTIPLISLGHLLRREMAQNLTSQYRARVASVSNLLSAELSSRGDQLDARVTSLGRSLKADNRLRRSLVQRETADASFLIEYAGDRMALSGLDVLQLIDDAGTVVSSGHFRNEFGRDQTAMIASLAEMPDSLALAEVPMAGEAQIALVRMKHLAFGNRGLNMLGGFAIEPIVSSMGGDPDVTVHLVMPDSAADPIDDQALRSTIPLPFIDAAGQPAGTAQILIEHSGEPLVELREQIDSSIMAAVVLTSVVALLIALWLAGFISKPLNRLASETTRMDLDRLDVEFASNRKDEVGTLSRLLREMVSRLRLSAQRIREAERRAAVGDLARQVNHDIKNGLTPLRNVFQHLEQVSRDTPEQLNGVFAERKGTLESSLEYLGNLASNYARLTPSVQQAECDVNDLIREIVAEHHGRVKGVTLRHSLSDGLPSVHSDRLALRRVVENLTGNAIDAVGDSGAVEVRTTGTNSPPGVRIEVIDNGPGMTEQQAAQAFQDFYTTKQSGTGLGLSVVRRLVGDMGGRVNLDTRPGEGTRVIVNLPATTRGAVG